MFSSSCCKNTLPNVHLFRLYFWFWCYFSFQGGHSLTSFSPPHSGPQTCIWWDYWCMNHWSELSGKESRLGVQVGVFHLVFFSPILEDNAFKKRSNKIHTWYALDQEIDAPEIRTNSYTNFQVNVTRFGREKSVNAFLQRAISYIRSIMTKVKLAVYFVKTNPYY